MVLWDIVLMGILSLVVRVICYMLGLHRCQSFKVVQRQVREQTVHADTGKRTSKGNPVKFNRGDLVLTDCNVTGSNYGTASKPKFPLMELWLTVLCVTSSDGRTCTTWGPV